MSFLAIDRKSKDILEALKCAPIYKKQGLVKARLANHGERIETILESGITETVSHSKDGEYVVTNPGGEQYNISAEKFLKRYEPTNEEGVFAAKGFCKAIKNPFGVPIEIMASWGSPQIGDENCLIADTCDAFGNNDGEPYLIESKAFDVTYKLFVE